MSATVTLTDGIRVVELLDVREEAPGTATPLNVLPDVSGQPVVYTQHDVLNEVGLDGRLATFEEMATLCGWLSTSTLLAMIDRHGATTSGWRLRPSPAPTLRRKDGDSPDWLVTVRLWRLP